MQLLLTLLFCAAFALCLLLNLTWAIRAVGYPLLALVTYLPISIALLQRQLQRVPPQSWVAIPILAIVLVFRLHHLAQSQNLELSLCVIWMNLVFLTAFSIMYCPAGPRSPRQRPRITKKMRNKERKRQHQKEE